MMRNIFVCEEGPMGEVMVVHTADNSGQALHWMEEQSKERQKRLQVFLRIPKAEEFDEHGLPRGLPRE